MALPSTPALDYAKAAYLRRDFNGCLESLQRVGPADGVAVYARALELRGWVAKSDGDFGLAREHFTAALARLGDVHRYPRLEANLVTTLGYLAAESLDAELWAEMAARSAHVRWSAPGLGYWRWAFALCTSIVGETYGRPREALAGARDAIRLAPSTGYALLAYCRSAEVLRVYGDALGFEDHAETIRLRAAAIDPNRARTFEEVNALASAAETLALLGDGPGAAATLHRLDALDSARCALLHDEPIKVSYLAYVEGLVADANGDTLRARHRYHVALNGFRTLRLTRRELVVGLRLAELTRDAALVRGLLPLAVGLPATSWLRAAAERLSEDDPVARLGRAERETLALLVVGRSTAEIATARGRSPQTVRNTVSRLLHFFGVETRASLVAQYGRMTPWKTTR